MNVRQALESALSQGVARLDAQLLLLHALGRAQSDRAWLIAHDGDAVPDDVQAAYAQLCARRTAGEPLAYLVGMKEFHGLALRVDRRVLVPRPDTETLVDWAIALLQGDRAARVIDLGTGSGAIALAIKQARPHAIVEAVDASTDALDVARANAQSLSLDVSFARADWLDGAAGPFDLIVSNPPYIAAGDPHLAGLVNEPPGALISGTDGLDDLRRIVAAAPKHLTNGGWLLLEHGWDQAEAVRGLLGAAGLREISTRRDLGGNDRVSGAKWLELG